MSKIEGIIKDIRKSICELEEIISNNNPDDFNDIDDDQLTSTIDTYTSHKRFLERKLSTVTNFKNRVAKEVTRRSKARAEQFGKSFFTGEDIMNGTAMVTSDTTIIYKKRVVRSVGWQITINEHLINSNFLCFTKIFLSSLSEEEKISKPMNDLTRWKEYFSKTLEDKVVDAFIKANPELKYALRLKRYTISEHPLYLVGGTDMNSLQSHLFLDCCYERSKLKEELSRFLGISEDLSNTSSNLVRLTGAVIMDDNGSLLKGDKILSGISVH